MEYLPGGLTLELAQGTFPLSTDSILLSHFAKLPRSAKVLDLGSGCATLGHLLCAKDELCLVAGIELDPLSHSCALDNIRRNGLTQRLTSICGDLRQLPQEYVGKFDCCISNPPYFSGGPASKKLTSARRDDHCSCADLFSAASRAVKFGGDFFLVQRPERLAELIARGAENKLEAKRLCLIRHRKDGPVTLILLQFRKGAKPGLSIEEEYLFESDQQPSRFYREIYHIQEG